VLFDLFRAPFIAAALCLLATPSNAAWRDYAGKTFIFDMKGTNTWKYPRSSEKTPFSQKLHAYISKEGRLFVFFSDYVAFTKYGDRVDVKGDKTSGFVFDFGTGAGTPPPDYANKGLVGSKWSVSHNGDRVTITWKFTLRSNKLSGTNVWSFVFSDECESSANDERWEPTPGTARITNVSVTVGCKIVSGRH
jgi:hypothetical protein